MSHPIHSRKAEFFGHMMKHLGSEPQGYNFRIELKKCVSVLPLSRHSVIWSQVSMTEFSTITF